jgi:hypothetical protein
VAGLWRGAPTALLFGHSRNIVGAADSEAARIALAVGNFLAVYQRVAVFDLLGMVAATVRARGHLSPVELHVPDGMRRSNDISAYGETGRPRGEPTGNQIALVRV